MAENPDRDPLPQATAVPRRRARVSVVWIIPLLAAVVALGIAIQRVLSEGPTITIIFKGAEGLEAGKTFVKYKDVNIGQVTSVELASDYSRVEVKAKIAKSAAGLMVEDAKFWVVEPRITLSGVSGLGTLLSGNYIGFQAGTSKVKQRSFTGLDVPPVIMDAPGRSFTLKAADLGSLGIGAPIYYRSLQAGQVVAYELAPDGKGVVITVFVNAPYDKYVTSDTRFWNASGIDVSVGAGGVDVRTEGLVALLAGGLAFDTPSVGLATEPAAANSVFTLYRDRVTAMKQPESIARRYVLNFSESVRGLSVGAPVTLFGINAGEVTDVGLTFDPATLVFRPRVHITFFPERIIARLSSPQQVTGRALFEQSEELRLRLLRRIVEERGLRGQLQSGSLLTGQLLIAFDYFPNAPKVKLNWAQEPLELPVVPSALPELEAKVTGILTKLDNLPLEALGQELKKDLAALGQTLEDVSKLLRHLDTGLVSELGTTVAAANKLLARVDAELVGELQTTIKDATRLLGSVDAGLKTTLEEARRALAAADRVLNNADASLAGRDSAIQQDLRDALQEIAGAARSIRVLADYLERHPESLLRGKTEEKK